jgi:hypothetical protein
MDLSTFDVLVGLGAIAALTGGAAVVYRRRAGSWGGRRPGESSGAERQDPGRHHVPKGLLDDPTTRLGPDLLARMKKRAP